MKISFIGSGNMADAIISAVINHKLSGPREIVASDIKEERRQYLSQKYGIIVTGDNVEAAVHGDVVVMAIKPQNLGELTPGIKGQLKPDQLVLSIIAGASIRTLRNGLAHRQIVRAMPNTPAQIGEGMTAWTATPEVTALQKERAQAILGAMGKEVYFKEEKYLDMATAVSGSGPAYVFLFAEALASAALQIGLPPEVAAKMVLQTLSGSVNLLLKSDKTPEELRRMVTSPGGTTAEAIAIFEKGNFPGLVSQAVSAAYQRAKQLGN